MGLPDALTASPSASGLGEKGSQVLGQEVARKPSQPGVIPGHWREPLHPADGGRGLDWPGGWATRVGAGAGRAAERESGPGRVCRRPEERDRQPLLFPEVLAAGPRVQPTGTSRWDTCSLQPPGPGAL